MAKINIGFYLKPHIWIGIKDSNEKATELAVIKNDISPGIDIAIQRQGLVLASINTDQIPKYHASGARNLICSETASFALNFLNAFSFAFYEAQLIKANGAFQSAPQEVVLDDLYLWSANQGSIEAINQTQPFPICSGEHETFREGVNKLKKTVGQLDNDDLEMRWKICSSVFTEHLDKQLLAPKLIKIISILNRGIVCIRGASFDIALISFWTVIELIMKDLWSNFLVKKSLPNKRREFLTGRDITASILSENLNLHGIIDEQLYNDVSEARRSRNKLMHELKPIDSRVCYNAFISAKKLIKIYHSIEITHSGSFFMGDFSFAESSSK